jgi:hypothetical protein
MERKIQSGGEGLLGTRSAAVQNWPRAERDKFELYFIEGFDPDEIAMVTRQPSIRTRFSKVSSAASVTATKSFARPKLSLTIEPRRSERHEEKARENDEPSR